MSEDDAKTPTHISDCLLAFRVFETSCDDGLFVVHKTVIITSHNEIMMVCVRL